MPRLVKCCILRGKGSGSGEPGALLRLADGELALGSFLAATGSFFAATVGEAEGLTEDHPHLNGGFWPLALAFAGTLTDTRERNVTGLALPAESALVGRDGADDSRATVPLTRKLARGESAA